MDLIVPLVKYLAAVTYFLARLLLSCEVYILKYRLDDPIRGKKREIISYLQFKSNTQEDHLLPEW